MKWTTKDGKKLKVSEMSTGHIQNALRMLKRKGYIGLNDLNFYLTCVPPTADIASYQFEQEFDRVIQSPVTKWIDKFEKELNKRKTNQPKGERNERREVCSKVY